MVQMKGGLRQQQKQIGRREFCAVLFALRSLR